MMASFPRDVFEYVSDEWAGHEGVELGFVHGQLPMKRPVWVVPVSLDQLGGVLPSSAVADLEFCVQVVVVVCYRIPQGGHTG